MNSKFIFFIQLLFEPAFGEQAFLGIFLEGCTFFGVDCGYTPGRWSPANHFDISILLSSLLYILVYVSVFSYSRVEISTCKIYRIHVPAMRT